MDLIGDDLPFDVIEKFENYHYSREEAELKAIIVHSFGTQTIGEIFDIFNKLNVGAHFIVPEMTCKEVLELYPELFKIGDNNKECKYPDKVPAIQTVEIKNAAKHAGVSTFADINDRIAEKNGLNLWTIGIEFHSPGYCKYTCAKSSDFYTFLRHSNGQIETGIALISHMINKYEIPKENILGHSTIAPDRKTDPGPFFFWRELYEAGLGYMPEATAYNPDKRSYNESDIIVRYVDNFNDDLQVLIESRASLDAQNQDKVCGINYAYHSKNGYAELSDIANIIKMIQETLLAIGFNKCPQDGVFDMLTQNHITSYTMQFAPHLYDGRCTPITKQLLESLEKFDKNMFT